MNVMELARQALLEDSFQADRTVAALPAELRGVERHFALIAKENGVFSGRAWVLAVMECAGLRSQGIFDEGQPFAAGEAVVVGRGPAGAVLSAERTLLNTLQQLCGVATLTRRFVDQLKGATAGIYHTRKTLPLLRELQVQAVLAGGGKRHRLTLQERALLKENHKYLAARAGLAFPELVRRALGQDAQALVEVENPSELQQALEAGARHLLCDNFSPTTLREVLPQLPAGTQVEVSGGITLETVAQYAQPGVQRISVGALTHSARAIDLSLDWVEL